MDDDDQRLLERIQQGDGESFGVLYDRTWRWLLSCVVTPRVGPAAAEDVLGFSDTQLASFKTLAEARSTAGQALQTQIGTAQKALADALAATTPVPAAVGSALLAVRSLEKQGQQIDQTFRTGFKALLTSTQAQKYAELEAFRETGREAGALSSLGL